MPILDELEVTDDYGDNFLLTDIEFDYESEEEETIETPRSDEFFDIISFDVNPINLDYDLDDLKSIDKDPIKYFGSSNLSDWVKEEFGRISV